MSVLDIVTIAGVKNSIPFTLPVKLGDGTITDGMVTGKQCEYPLVYITLHGSTFKVEATWQTIANCLTHNRPLQA